MENPPDLPQATDLRPYSPTEELPSTALTLIRNDLVQQDEPTQLHGDGDAPFLAHDCGYNSSASSTQHSASDILADADDDDDRHHHSGGAHSRASSRSSVSSMPASVLTHTMDGFKTSAMQEIHDNVPTPPWEDRDHQNKGYNRMLHTVREREAAFRKPSSVRAMQMHTEDEGDDEFLTPPKRKGGRVSDISMRSAGSSPLKRSPYYSPTGSLSKSHKSAAKKEYPLVLLHCNLLPPSLPIPGLTGHPDQKVLKEVLPTMYWRRWKLLEEKVGSGVLRDRGVLISHPEDMYDVLEERLLESLELQRPRLDHGHFIGDDDADSDKGVQSATDDEQGEECPDCGGRVVHHSDAGRKWEIRVFAANGLMRAGAWAAAWREMEKVDVEVGLWLPSEVRRALEKRLIEDDVARNENFVQLQEHRLSGNSLEHSPDQLRLRRPTPIQFNNDSPTICISTQGEGARPPSASGTATHHERRTPDRLTHAPTHKQQAVEIDLQTLLVNYIRVLATDKRNVAIVFLSVLVVFFGLGYRPQVPISDMRPFPQDMVDPRDLPTMPVVQYSSAAVVTSTVSEEIPVADASESSILASPSTSESFIEIPPTSTADTTAEDTVTSVSEPTQAAGVVQDEVQPNDTEAGKTEETSTSESAAVTSIIIPAEEMHIETLEAEPAPVIDAAESLGSEAMQQEVHAFTVPPKENLSIVPGSEADPAVEPAAFDQAGLSELVDSMVHAEPKQNSAGEQAQQPPIIDHDE